MRTMEEETLDQFIRRSEAERIRLMEEQTRVLIQNGALVEQMLRAFGPVKEPAPDPEVLAQRTRDHQRFVFANAAIEGLSSKSENTGVDPNALARRAWAIADAMIRNGQ